VTTPQTSTRPARGAELELTVDTLAHGGNGVARLDGYVVFVAGALPGDRVRAVVGKSKRAYAEARTVEILEPSPDRIAPLADHPGVPWQVLSYERQLAVKAEQVGDALRRIGRLEGFEQDPIVPAVEQWRYRNKLEYSFGTGPDGSLVCGFHAPGRFDEILAVGDEPFQRKCLARIRELKAAGHALVIVSHDLNMVSELCERGILLEQGKVIVDGPVETAVAEMRARF